MPDIAKAGWTVGSLVVAALASLAHGNIVTNGGFETGEFFPWFVPPNVPPPNPNAALFVVSSGGGSHSGTYHARLASSDLQYMGQILPSVAGTDYELSFWLRRGDLAPDSFFVRWEGATVLSLFPSNPDFFTWRQYTVAVHSDITGSLLEFGQDYFPGEFHIDDISVVQVPAPGAAALLAVSSLFAQRRRRRA